MTGPMFKKGDSVVLRSSRQQGRIEVDPLRDPGAPGQVLNEAKFAEVGDPEIG